MYGEDGPRWQDVAELWAISPRQAKKADLVRHGARAYAHYEVEFLAHRFDMGLIIATIEEAVL